MPVAPRVAAGGAALAPINVDVVGGIPDDLATQVAEREDQIKAGTFRVDINEATPPGSVIPEA